MKESNYCTNEAVISREIILPHPFRDAIADGYLPIRPDPINEKE
jgi:hypothetical protein